MTSLFAPVASHYEARDGLVIESYRLSSGTAVLCAHGAHRIDGEREPPEDILVLYDSPVNIVVNRCERRRRSGSNGGRRAGGGGVGEGEEEEEEEDGGGGDDD
jgi:hypothetical protein